MTTLQAASQAAQLSDAEFARLAAIAAKEAGLSIPSSKKSLVQSRISRRMRELGLRDCGAYLARLDTDASETRELISVLTTNVSNFYRERHHFEYLLAKVVPHLAEKLRRGGRVRIWSAGCSSGQEPYTIAIELLKAMPEASSADILVLGSDIDPKILRRAVDGVYTHADLEPVAPPDRRAFFQAAGDGQMRVADRVRALVRFRELNLHAAWPMKGTFDAIFCRNVVIYFDDEVQRRLWPRFRDKLEPEGCLFLGHSERIHPLDDTGFRTAGVTIYQKT